MQTENERQIEVKRYIIINFPAYETGYFWCAVDSLDEIQSTPELEAIDTRTGDMFRHSVEQRRWVKYDNIGEYRCKRAANDSD